MKYAYWHGRTRGGITHVFVESVIVDTSTCPAVHPEGHGCGDCPVVESVENIMTSQDPYAVMKRIDALNAA